MSNLNNYYVYRHIRLDKNTPFYVGKGRGTRAFQKGKRRNKYWNNIIARTDYRIEIIEENLTEEQAFKKEIELIKLYKSQDFCEANMTDGGTGGDTFSHQSDKSKIRIRQKISKLHKGRKRTNKTCKNISEALKGKSSKRRVSVIGTNIKTGDEIHLEHMRSDSRFTQTSISRCITGHYKTHAGYIWRRA